MCVVVFCIQYFESDDPDLYTAKIQYIRENDVSDLELVFAEEEFTEDGTAQVGKRIPLVGYDPSSSGVLGDLGPFLRWVLGEHRTLPPVGTRGT